MNRHPLAGMLKKEVLLFDGATGTYAASLPGFPQEPVERACLTDAEKVAQMHEEYLRAGCRAIKTNTFAAYPGVGAENESEQERMIRAAFRIACGAAEGFGAYVFADIGPAPVWLDASQAYQDAACIFLDAGADCFLFETMASIDGICETADMIRQKKPDAFIAVSFAVNPDGYTRTGESANMLIARAAACDAVDAVGLNCVCGAYHMRKLLESIRYDVNKPMIAMPNAGYPHVVDGRTYYDSDPVYYADQAAACVSLGVRVFGGCCGTTPQHIRALRRALGHETAAVHTEEGGRPAASAACRSRLKQKTERGERVFLVELDPPASPDVSQFMRGAKLLDEAGADAITIADCPIGRASMDSSLLACKLRRYLGIEALPHMTCRDRNVNATKALLLGLSMEDVHNVLVVTGDPVPSSDRENVKSVFQFNSQMMARFVRGLEGTIMPFFLCGALNINARNFEHELQRAREKEEAGIEAFLTQPVLSRQAVRNIQLARDALRGKIFAGLFPVVSHRNASFLHSEVAGIALDEDVLKAYENLDRGQGEAMAVRLCTDAARAVSSCVDGFYIMTPFMRVALVKRVLESIRRV